jgi:hypothetical protein
MIDVRPIPGFPGYVAHEDGYIISYWRREPLRGRRGSRGVIGEIGIPIRAFDRKLADGSLSGYLSVCVRHSDGRRRNRYLHELILLAFVGPRPTEQHEALHGDANGYNNHRLNLRWGTVQENADDRERHGHVHRGDAWYRSRGLPPPWLVQEDSAADVPASSTETRGAFDDLLEPTG